MELDVRLIIKSDVYLFSITFASESFFEPSKMKVNPFQIEKEIFKIIDNEVINYPCLGQRSLGVESPISVIEFFEAQDCKVMCFPESLKLNLSKACGSSFNCYEGNDRGSAKILEVEINKHKQLLLEVLKQDNDYVSLINTLYAYYPRLLLLNGEINPKYDSILNRYLARIEELMDDELNLRRVSC